MLKVGWERLTYTEGVPKGTVIAGAVGRGEDEVFRCKEERLIPVENARIIKGEGHFSPIKNKRYILVYT